MVFSFLAIPLKEEIIAVILFYKSSLPKWLIIQKRNPQSKEHDLWFHRYLMWFLLFKKSRYISWCLCYSRLNSLSFVLFIIFKIWIDAILVELISTETEISWNLGQSRRRIFKSLLRWILKQLHDMFNMFLVVCLQVSIFHVYLFYAAV